MSMCGSYKNLFVAAQKVTIQTLGVPGRDALLRWFTFFLLESSICFQIHVHLSWRFSVETNLKLVHFVLCHHANSLVSAELKFVTIPVYCSHSSLLLSVLWVEVAQVPMK